jgi:hypothetical protein
MFDQLSYNSYNYEIISILEREKEKPYAEINDQVRELSGAGGIFCRRSL